MGFNFECFFEVGNCFVVVVVFEFLYIGIFVWVGRFFSLVWGVLVFWCIVFFRVVVVLFIVVFLVVFVMFYMVYGFIIVVVVIVFLFVVVEQFLVVFLVEFFVVYREKCNCIDQFYNLYYWELEEDYIKNVQFGLAQVKVVDVKVV